MTDIELCLRMIVAVVCGAIIGAEREWRGKPAGLRTNTMICLGASIFTLISSKIAAAHDGDVTRIAAQIVTGIGFIGAGAIIRSQGGVHGLTTAATIWLVAAIGMCCGAGFYFLAGISTVVAFLVLLGLPPIDNYMAKIQKRKNPHDGIENNSSQ